MHVAGFDYLNLTEEQRKALEGNIANMPKIEELGNLFQQFYLDQMDTAFGGTGVFRDIMASGGRTTQEMLDTSEEMLHGEVPKDVQEAVQRSSAYQSLMGGYSGSQMSGANAARNLGLTSLAMINQGAGLQAQAGNAAQRWAALSGSGAMANMLITPAQQTDLDLKQAMIKHDIKQQKENIKAQRDPVIGGLSDIVETLTAAYVGSLGGGMGGSKGNINNAPASATTSLNPAFETATPENAGDWSNSGFNFDTGSTGSVVTPTTGLSKDSGNVNNTYDLPTAGSDNYGSPWAMGGPAGQTSLAASLYGIQGLSQFNQQPNNPYPYTW